MIAKITDFGISTQGDTTAKMERSLVGTPWYMAPEIINEEAYSNKVFFFCRWKFNIFSNRLMSGLLVVVSYNYSLVVNLFI